MPRLFVAIPLAEATTAALVSMQPEPGPGIRLVEPDQMHLTLQYIGDVDDDQARSLAGALNRVAASQFSLVIEGAGRFLSSGGATTLWAGVREHPGLRALHQAVADVLSSRGIRQESRPYTPHIAVARCGPEVPTEVIKNFVVEHQRFALPAETVTTFCLYTSMFVSEVPRYEREQIYPLQLA